MKLEHTTDEQVAQIMTNEKCSSPEAFRKAYKEELMSDWYMIGSLDGVKALMKRIIEAL